MLKLAWNFFYAVGPEIITYVKSLGHDIFLDLKLHDIPNTVESTMRVLAQMGIKMTTVHAAGTTMLEAARRGLGNGPLLIAVTQLTSTSQQQMQEDQTIQSTLLESVLHYAKKAAQADLDGVVCSAYEVEAIKQTLAHDFSCVTPGIRPSGSEVGDQQRVMTPSRARLIGSDYIVVGRPITQAQDPVASYQAIKEEWNASINTNTIHKGELK